MLVDVTELLMGNRQMSKINRCCLMFCRETFRLDWIIVDVTLTPEHEQMVS